MKTIGLIGGMSCGSIAHYNARPNGRVRDVLGSDVSMLLNERNVPLSIFDTTLIHADAAVDFALGDLPTAQAAE